MISIIKPKPLPLLDGCVLGCRPYSSFVSYLHAISIAKARKREEAVAVLTSLLLQRIQLSYKF